MNENVQRVIEGIADTLGIYGERRCVFVGTLMDQIEEAVQTDARLNTTLTLGELTKLSLNPGDAIVITAAKPLSADQVAYIGAAVNGMFPEVAGRVLVLDAGLKLGVLEAGSGDERCADGS